MATEEDWTPEAAAIFQQPHYQEQDISAEELEPPSADLLPNRTNNER